MKFHNVTQGTDEWFNLRKGKFTASNFKDLFAKETTATYEKAIYKVVYERLTNEKVESEFQSYYMKRGTELEAEALKRYSLITFNKVNNGGFVELNDFIGASPDGLIGETGLVQVKCPAFNTMINYLLKKQLPTEYHWQVYGEMFVTGREWCDFFAYHPALECVVIRVFKDLEIEKELSHRLEKSINLVKDILTKL